MPVGKLYRMYREWSEWSGDYVRQDVEFNSTLDSRGFIKKTPAGRKVWLGLKIGLLAQGFLELSAETQKGANMGYYRTCPYCGAHLDPGELCDCGTGKAADHFNEKAKQWRGRFPIVSTQRIYEAALSML